jgi:hypothetical protein
MQGLGESQLPGCRSREANRVTPRPAEQAPAHRALASACVGVSHGETVLIEVA